MRILKILLNFYHRCKAAQLIANLIDSVIDVRSVEDMNRAFESDIKKAGGKTIMKWNV